jgi:hypothetical protein
MIDIHDREGTPETRDLQRWATPAKAIGIGELLIPPFCIIPKEFFHGNTKWNEFQRRWFFKGLSVGTRFVCKPGIDEKAALGHLSSIQRSWAPAYEHKEAAVAWLASQWFEDVVYPEVQPPSLGALVDEANGVKT